MPESITFDLPIAGMTCASCAGRVERALRKVAGAEQVNVNLATEQARVQAPADRLPALVEAVTQAGYSVPSQSIELQIGGMTCASCAGRVERALNKVPGVQSVSVNLASERAHVEVLGQPDSASLIAAVSVRLEQFRVSGERLDAITFAGNGEPTLHPAFPELIEKIIFVTRRPNQV